MAKRTILPVLAALVALALPVGQTRTQTPEQTAPPQDPIIYLAGVERFDIVVLETEPVQVRVAVYGWMADACTSIRDFRQVQEERVIFLKIYTIRPAEAICAQQTKRFRETFPLDIAGLAPGDYTLDVSGKRQDFTVP